MSIKISIKFKNLLSLGMIINALGIDMLWHGVEINHAVYALVLQDMILALLTTMMTLMFNWSFWYYEETWFKFHGFFTMFSLIFQDWCWGSVAYLR